MKKANERGKKNPAGIESLPAAAGDSSLSPSQTSLFEQGIDWMHRQDFQKARELFEQAGRGPLLEVAHSARLHARMCERRLASQAAQPKNPDELYNLAIALINQRELRAAETYLRQAIEQSPRGDHLYYALALCCGLGGDFEGAYGYLKHAIGLQPRNRVLARNDPDFAEIARQSRLGELLYPERT